MLTRSENVLTARRCVPPVTSLRCQGPTRSEVQSTHLLHQCVHALLLHFKGTKPISVESATDKSNRKHHHTLKLAPSVIPERQLASGRATSLSLRLCSSESTKLQLPDRFSIDPKKLDTRVWKCDPPDTDDSQHPPPRGICMPQSHPQQSHTHDSRAGIRRCRDMPNRVKRSSAEFALCSPSCDDCSPAECMSHCTVDETRQKYTPYPETNMCTQRMSTTVRKVQQQRQQPFQPTGSEKTTAVPGPNFARQQRQKPVWSTWCKGHAVCCVQDQLRCPHACCPALKLIQLSLTT